MGESVKFSRGDRVVKDDSEGLISKGTQGTVKKVETRGGEVHVHVHFEGHPGGRWWDMTQDRIKKA